MTTSVTPRCTNRQVVLKLTSVAVVALCTVGVIWWPKVSILSEALYWQARALLYDGHNADTRPAVHLTGEIKGLTEEGYVVYMYAGQTGYITAKSQIADIEIVDAKSTLALINTYRGKTIFIDQYSILQNGEINLYVVLWEEFDTSINRILVERGFAKPMQSPPTNVINTLMATYYWQRLME